MCESDSSPGGAIAFSEPLHLGDTPSAGAVAFWAGEGHRVGTAETIAARVASAGYRTLATRVLSDVAWEGYFRPLEDRIARLRPTADARLATALDMGVAEIAAWRAHRRETGYLLSVVRPA